MSDTKGFPTEQQIAQRAYEIYLERGGENGRDIEHWFAAESELFQHYTASVSSARKTRVAVGRQTQLKPV